MSASRRVLRVEDVSVSLGGRRVLDRVSFSVEGGEFCGLIGSNGAGKTTLLRVILGLINPSGGRIVVTGGTRTTGTRRLVTFHRRSSSRRTCRCGRGTWSGSVSTGTASGSPSPTAKRRIAVEEMLDAVGATRFADARIGNLSGGEQQRVMIAQALICRPKLLLLDEPLANLDIRSAAEVVELLARIAAEQRIAILLSAHDMNPLLPVMDRVVYLADGRAASGTTEEVVRTDTLSRLYGHHVEVIHVPGRVLVVSGAEHQAHHPGDTDPFVRERVMLARLAWSSLFEPGFFTSEPVQVALVVGAIAAVVSGIVGVFTVIRGQSFAGHALADIGTAGGSAAVLVGASTLYGYVAFNVVAAGVMELIGIRKPRGRDLATGIVLGASLGLAALFLYEDTISSSTTGATVNVLFGSIFTLPPGITTVMAVLGVASVALIAVLYRPLLLSSVSYELAAARRVPVRLVGGGYLLALALAVSMSAVTIGAILSTALLIGPAAIALRLATRTGVAIAVAAAVGVFACWAGTLDCLRQHRLGWRERLAGQLLHRGRHLRPLLRLGGRLSPPNGPATGDDQRSAQGSASRSRWPDVRQLHDQRVGGGHRRGHRGRRSRVLHGAARRSLRCALPSQRGLRRSGRGLPDRRQHHRRPRRVLPRPGPG